MQPADDVSEGRLWRSLLRKDSISQGDRLIEIHILALLKIGVAVGEAYSKRRVFLWMMQAKPTEIPASEIAAPAVTIVSIAPISGISTQKTG